MKKAAKDADAVYLAADPDREGEAICQHLAEEIVPKKPKKPAYRVMFNEITKRAVNEAFEHPRQIDENLVDAQQARRVLDRLVGYKVSPLLCRAIGGRLSAGRVQSVALRMVVEREREIEQFIKTEYWTITANLAAKLPYAARGVARRCPPPATCRTARAIPRRIESVPSGLLRCTDRRRAAW